MTTFFTCFSRGESRKYARKKVCLNRVHISNSQPSDHESDTLTTEPPLCMPEAFNYTRQKQKQKNKRAMMALSRSPEISALCGIALTLYHKIPNFNDLEKDAF